MSPDLAETAVAEPLGDLATPGAVPAPRLGLGARRPVAADSVGPAASKALAVPGAPSVPRALAAAGTPAAPRAPAAPWAPSVPRALARLRADPARMAAVRETWRALWVSRLLVWVAGAGTVATLGFGPVRHAFDPPGATRGFGWLGDVLAAPAARWDSAWYLTIAHYGYRPDLGSFTAPRTAFFPLYPLGLREISDLGAPPVLAGVLLSLLALAFGLYGLHRLTTLEAARLRLPAGGETARLAFFFSAVYSESLYLSLSVGVFLFARRGRWAPAATCAALAGATRSSGIV